MTGPEPQPIAAAEAEAFCVACEAAFHVVPHAEDLAIDLRTLDPERMLVIREEGQIVATAAIIGRELSVPGGGAVPAAAVTAVGVLPGHTRRGHLTSLMRRQLDELRAGGEAIACLWSSEAGLYRRYGYGPATRSLVIEVRTPAALRADAPRPAARARAAEPAAVRDRLTMVYDATRHQRPGQFDRPTAAWWDRRLHDPEHRREGAGPLRAAVQAGPDGAPAGYALYSVTTRWGDQGPDGQTDVRELVATTPEAAAGLWEHLLGLDLVRTLRWHLAATGEALLHLLAAPDAHSSRSGDGLWVRLVDVDRALVARGYAHPFAVTLAVEDAFCPWNTGRHRLTYDGEAATCEPAGGEPDLELTAEALGAAYLGGTSLAELAAAGLVRERRPGALATAASAFRAPVEPWCPEII